MSRTRAAPLLRLLYRLAAGREALLPDADLLQRYLDRRDEAAFAALVQRHGPMVLGVCRSVLRHPHDAEDAFQATFLVLAHKAGSIRRRDGLGSFLHGVARRVALKARAGGIRRQEVEARAAPPAADPTLDDVTWGELREALHTELASLPGRFREPLVLCYLEGLAQDEAARRLGWSPTTVKGRLRRGRDLLRRRLERRGLAPAVALTAALTGQALAAPVPAALAEATARTAVQFTTQGAMASAAALLARGVLQQTAPVKLKVLSAALLAVAAVAGGIGMLPRQPAPQAPVAERPAEQRPGPRTDLYGDPLPEGAVARIGTTRLRANYPICVIAFSHDGRRLAYGIENGSVRACEAADGKPLLDLLIDNTRIRPVTELAFSPDGRTLAAGGYWSEVVCLIDLARRKVRHTIPNTAVGQDRWGRLWQGPGFAFTPDGRTLIIGGKDGALHLWDTATGTEQATLAKTAEPALCLTLTADGQIALTAHRGGALHLWDVANRKHLRKLAASAKYPYLTTLAPDGKTVALASGAAELELWDPDGGRRHQLRSAAPVVGLGFTPGGASLRVADGDGRVTVWDAWTGKKRNALACEGVSLRGADGHVQPMPSAWFRADGKTMAWAVTTVIRPWDLTTGQETPRLTLFRQGVQWAGFSADGRLLRAAGASGELGVWDAATGRPHVQPRRTDLTLNTRYTPAADRGRVVAVTAGNDIVTKPKPGEGRIFLWHSTGDVGPVPLREQAGPAWYAALTPDNRFLAATEVAGRIQVYDAAAGKPARSFDGRKYEYRPTFSPDGVLLATTGSDEMIRLYDFATGRLVRELKGLFPASCLAFSPDGRTLASGHLTEHRGRQPGQPSDTICLWDIPSGRELQRIVTRHHVVQALSFSPDGRLLASCGLDGAVRLWEVASGQERRRYDGHGSWVQSIDFAPDGGRLVSASLDGTALVWRVFGPAPAERPTTDFATLWADLARDGITAHRAMASLIAAPRQAVPLLCKRLRPVAPADPQQVARLIAELDSERFAVRENATRELEQLGELAEPLLRRAREGSPPLEFRRRVEQLLERLQGPVVSPERLRDLRAVAVLEHLGGAEARRLLGELAKGAGEARLTREAKATLARLERR